MPFADEKKVVFPIVVLVDYSNAVGAIFSAVRVHAVRKPLLQLATDNMTKVDNAFSR